MIKRTLRNITLESGENNSIIQLCGARHVGKSRIIKNLNLNDDNMLWLMASRIDVRRMIEDLEDPRLGDLLANKQYLVVEDSDRIDNISMHLERVVTYFKDLQIILICNTCHGITCSVPVEQRRVPPITFGEMVQHHGLLEEKSLLLLRVCNGYYPKVVACLKYKRKKILDGIIQDLFADVYRMEHIRKPKKFELLLELLALGVGKILNYGDLASTSGLNVATIQRYIELLEQGNIVYRIRSFQQKLNAELAGAYKLYFWDNGILCNLITRSKSKHLVNLERSIWENFLISERKKIIEKENLGHQQYFWITNTNREVDYLEEIKGKLCAFDFRWSINTIYKPAPLFISSYPEIPHKIIRLNNPEELLML